MNTTITVVGLSEKESQQSLLKGQPQVYIKLSAVPVTEWTDQYNAYQSYPNHQLPFESRVSGNWIVVKCNPKEFTQRHLEALNFDVQQIDCLLQAKAKNGKIIQEFNSQKDTEAEKSISELKSRLNFNSK